MRLRRRFSFLRLVLQRMVTAPRSTRRVGASAVRGVTKRCVGCPMATLAPPPRVKACAGESGRGTRTQSERAREDFDDDERCWRDQMRTCVAVRARSCTRRRRATMAGLRAKGKVYASSPSSPLAAEQGCLVAQEGETHFFPAGTRRKFVYCCNRYSI